MNDAPDRGPPERERFGGDHEFTPKEKPSESSGGNLIARATERELTAKTTNERATGLDANRMDAEGRAKLEAFLKELREALEKDKLTNHRLTKEDFDKIIELAREQLLDRPSDWFTIDDKVSTKDKKASEKTSEIVSGFYKGLVELYKNYKEMRGVNLYGADRYFHCLAHCGAASNGTGGELASKLVSVLRENYDMSKGLVTGTSVETIMSDCFADTYINREGFLGRGSGTRCMDHCARFKPRGL